MSEDSNKNNKYYCEICGDFVFHGDAKEIICHGGCLRNIKDLLNMLRKISNEIREKQLGEFTFERNVLRLLLCLKIQDLEKSEREHKK